MSAAPLSAASAKLAQTNAITDAWARMSATFASELTTKPEFSAHTTYLYATRESNQYLMTSVERINIVDPRIAAIARTVGSFGRGEPLGTDRGIPLWTAAR